MERLAGRDLNSSALSLPWRTAQISIAIACRRFCQNPSTMFFQAVSASPYTSPELAQA